MAKYDGSVVKSRDELIDDQKSRKLLTDIEAQTAKETGVVTIGKKTIEYGTDAKTLVEAFKAGEINVGDYITNYNSTLYNSNATVSVTGEETGGDFAQTYKVDLATTWRVVGLNEAGTELMITTGSPIKKQMDLSAKDEEAWKRDPYLYLSNAEGWYHTNDELVSNNILDKICSIYNGKLARATKSMRIEDINTALGITLDKANNKIYKTADETKTAISAYTGFFGPSYKYKTGDYAPENYLKEKYPTKYATLQNKVVGDVVNGTAYGYTYTDPSVVDQSSKLYDVLFKGTTQEENGAKGYWLASSGATKVEDSGHIYCHFRFRGCLI